MKHQITLTTAEALSFIKSQYSMASGVPSADIEVVLTDQPKDVIDPISLTEKDSAEIFQAIATGRNSIAIGIYSKLKGVSTEVATIAIQSLLDRYFEQYVGYGYQDARKDHPSYRV